MNSVDPALTLSTRADAVNLDSTGMMRAFLVCTDDPDIEPHNSWTYQFKGDWAGSPIVTCPVPMVDIDPETGKMPPLNLSTAVSRASVSGVLITKGKPGDPGPGIASIDTDGTVHLTDGSTVSWELPPAVADDAAVAELVASVSETAAAVASRIREVGDGTYAPVDSAVGRAQRAWLRALASRNVGVVNALGIGASTLAGHNSAPRWRKFWNLLGEACHAEYNPVGIAGGYHSLLTETGSWTFTGTTATTRRGLGTGSIAFSAGATGVYPLVSTTGFIVYYAQGPGQGPFKVKIDNGVPVTITPNTTGAYRHDGKFVSQNLIRGEHTIQIIAVGAVDINSVYVLDQDHNAGVRFYTAALGGNKSVDYLDPSLSPTHWERVAALTPALIALCVGSNDHNEGIPVATYRATIDGILAKIESTLGYRPWVPLIAQQPRTFDFLSPIAPWSEYVQVLRDVAADNPDWVSFHDFGALFPQTEADGTGGGILSTDGAHPTTLGHEVAFMELARQWGIPARAKTAIAPPVGVPITPEVVSTVTPLSITSGLISRFSAKTLADHGLANGAAVTTWPVEQGSVYVPLSQTTESRKPIYRATGAPGSFPCVEFDAALTQSMAASWATALDTPVTILCVVEPTPAPAASQTVMSGVSSTRYLALQATNDSRWSLAPGQTSGTLRSSPSVVTTALHVIGGKFDGAGSALHVDKKTPTATGTMVTTAEQPVAGLSGISLGRSASNPTTGNFTGKVCEMAVYGRALSAVEISTLMTELGATYGVTVVA
ncbi:GDSL-type esterase/lipase family protein [Rhodococcus globerulus]|uniref:GDSL-type esterase/lipase family protein n=1 Tax=Rhodococcus globerulus TaxID=33008 RepID=A0ABU4BS99_RHOGO|nr:GDSL-type esterase/lipase family protein [Rhodococcus globerulus]MDV6267091.1 GDSL-type esterase/lipase family protein [Rhodococcus globerulus]